LVAAFCLLEPRLAFKNAPCAHRLPQAPEYHEKSVSPHCKQSSPRGRRKSHG
jgi:hypothetical protein